jgi:hypothetical protein
MLEHNSYKDPSQKLALAISCCFHALLILGAYQLPLKQWTNSSSKYSITLNPAWSQPMGTKGAPLLSHRPVSTTETETTPQPSIKCPQVKQPIQDQGDREIAVRSTYTSQNSSGNQKTTKHINSPVQAASEASKTINQEEGKTETIDERGLYKVHQGKQTGASLELAGWVWDVAPQPQDDTDEFGKIIFQITIDEFGEVIAVKTLEKTISPLLERIYKDALTALTFSKTVDHPVYSPTSTGKVTFILQAK